jgi:Hint domain
VSRAHCIFINGFLVPAATLVNWQNIVVCTDFDAPELNYFHIELENHNVVTANGAPAETLLPGSDIERFDNAAGVGADPREMKPYAPIIGLEGGRRKAASMARSIAAPVHDIRQPIDRIRDALHSRAVWSAAA